MSADLRTAAIDSIVKWLVSIGYDADVADSIAREFVRQHEVTV
jgi:hypothetical protein